MPHLLFLAFWFPPSRASGVYRALGITRLFVEKGWQVTVVTTDRPFLEDEVGSVDRSLEMHIPEGVVVHRVPFSFWDGSNLDLRSMSWLKATVPRLRRGLKARQAVPDKYEQWIGPAVDAGQKTHKKRPIDHVLATGNPYSAFEAARRIAMSAKVPYSIDFRDPWTFDVFTGRRQGSKSIRRAETAVVESAHACFHVNQAIADAYRRVYPESANHMILAPNGFDPASVGHARVRAQGDPLTFGILGTATSRWPLVPIFKAWERTRARLPPGSRLVFGGHLGYFRRNESALSSLFPDPSSGFEYVGPITNDDVASFYESVDVIVLPVPGGSMVTSGKVYEAMAMGLPLVCVQVEGGGAQRLIADYPLSIAAPPSPDSIADALIRAAKASDSLTRSESMRIRNDAIAKHERLRALVPIVRSLEETL